MKAARDYPILTVTAKGTRWLESGHPWVYDSDVAREPDESECENGALVDAEMVHRAVVVRQLHTSEAHDNPSFSSSAARMAIVDAAAMRLARKSGSEYAP